MDLESYKNARAILMKEHEEKYDSFTRLMLGLSVTFITLVLGLRSGNAEQLSLLLKTAVILHAFSILSGIWVQYIVMAKPIKDLKRAYKLAEDLRSGKQENPGWFDRPPSRTQVICFNIQVTMFISAFLSVVIAIV